MVDSKLNNFLFIFGSARSGTTILAKLIDSSPDILYRHEPDIAAPTTDIPFLPDRETYDSLAVEARNYAHRLTGVRNARTISSPPYFNKRFRSPLSNVLWRANAYLVKGCERAYIRFPAFDWLKPSMAPTILIKSVSSVVRAPLFHRALPSARFIHLARHPCAVANSRLRGLRGGFLDKPTYIEQAFSMPEAARYPLDEARVRSLGAAGQIAYVWMLHNDKVYTELEGHERYRFVSYEDLCVNPAKQLRSIYDFAGLEWQEQTASFVANLEHTNTVQHGFFGVNRNIKSRLYTWRENLSGEDIEEMEWVVGHSVLGRRFIEESRTTVREKSE